MKETGMMFKAPLVCAMLKDLKLTTRRIAKDVKHPDLGNLYSPAQMAMEPQHVINRACPYGGPGDRIYVRETFGYGGDAYTPDIYFRASHPHAPIQGRWYPAIHMRKADARLWLEITDVRLERLHAITDDDCWREGAIAAARPDKFSVHSVLGTDGKAYLSPRGAFSSLWESTGASWNANPWVWVLNFHRIKHDLCAQPPAAEKHKTMNKSAGHAHA